MFGENRLEFVPGWHVTRNALQKVKNSPNHIFLNKLFLFHLPNGFFEVFYQILINYLLFILTADNNGITQ